MRVLLVYSLRDSLTLRRPLASLGDIHIGLSYVSARLKACGHSTRLVVLSSEMPAPSLRMLEAAVAEFDPQVVGFTAVSTQFPLIREAARHLKRQWPKKFLILGGVHASLRPEEAVDGAFDALCVGEGEEPMAELLERLQAGQTPRGIPNLWLRQPDGSLEKNAPREFLAPLEPLPFPDREMWHEWVLARQFRQQVVLPSRGCPYNCSYCSNHALRKLAGGKYVRLREPADVAREIRELKARYAETSDVYLQSETIAVDLKWLNALADELSAFNRELASPIAYACNFRVARQFLKEEVFAALRRANVRTVEIGLESGSERVRAEVLRRHYSNDEFLEAVSLARRHGMAVNVYNMIGLPGETQADHQATVEVNHRACPDRSLTSIFFPYPGTDLFEMCQAQGLLNGGADSTAERWRATLELPAFSKAQIQRAFNRFEYRVYQGHRPWQFRFRKALRNMAFSRPWSHLLFMRLLPLWYAVRGWR